MTSGGQKPAKAAPPIWISFAAGGLGSVLGCTACHPFDVLKVRLQVQGEVAGREVLGGGAHRSPALSMKGMTRAIVLSDGVVAGFSHGLSGQILRAATYNCSKIGLYDVFKRQLSPQGGGTLNLSSQLLAGLVSGAIGAALSNPCDLILVRMLGDKARVKHEQRGYGNALSVLFQLKPSELIIGFWPNVARATITTACQLVSYDQAKQALIRHTPLENGVPCHITASVLAGVIAGVVSNPMDVVKTRLMNASPGTYKAGVGGVVMCWLGAVRNEGVMSLYKGCGVTILRQSTFTTFTFVAMEQIRAILL